MNEIKKEQTTTIKIYREFFAKAHSEVKKQIFMLKTPTLCKNCKECCKIRYSEYSPSELKAEGLDDFLQTFQALGDNFDIEKNHNAAILINEKYAKKIIEISNGNCWFYSCKFFVNEQCQKGKEKPAYCISYPQNVHFVLHSNCGYVSWQKAALEKLQNQMAKDILEKIKNIDDYKNNFNCSCCATCCKIASSEFSYEQLKEKAKNGDGFAQQFTSVFVPYETEIEARKAYGEYIEYLYETLGKDEKFYFYYCPKNKNNLCTDYENRPEICREFPTNPLMILPKCCGYKDWQEETHTATLLLHALVEIVDFYITKIKKALH